jgi:hypothetical protein
MESATFSYSRFSSAMQLVLTPLFMIFSLALMSGGAYMAFDSPENAFIGVGTIAAGLWVAVIMWQWVRYRHALRERYTLDSQGVVVESPTATTKLLWSDFERAVGYQKYGEAFDGNVIGYARGTSQLAVKIDDLDAQYLAIFNENGKEPLLHGVVFGRYALGEPVTGDQAKEALLNELADDE